MDGSNAGPNGRQYHVAVLDQGRMWVHNGDLGNVTILLEESNFSTGNLSV